MAGGYDFSKCKKLCMGTGTAAVVGAIFYEYIRLKRTLNKLVNSDSCNIERKRPDYIYIKYHIYKETMLKEKHELLADKNWINVIIHPVGKWWNTIKHSIAWRLLEVAKTGDHSDRLKAVWQLAGIDHLKDWDYRHLAQICDSRTAISLARNSCDIRWFLPPKSFGSLRQPKSLIYDMRHHLNALKKCACLTYFQSSAFDNFAILKEYEYTTQTTTNRMVVSKHEYECLRRILEAVFHLSKNEENIRLLINSGILMSLIEILKLFHNDLDMKYLLSKVIANLSICNEFNNDFFVTGWVGVLSRWMRDTDLRVQVTAAKALVNMDNEDIYSQKYEAKVYPLYPLTRVRKKQLLDIVFIHGLLGGVFVTWRQKDPKEPDLGLYESITYTEIAKANSNTSRKKEQTVSDVATIELIETLHSANELNSDYEVVFPDCPVDGNPESEGSFSVSGDRWINDDQNNEYTYCWPMDWLPKEYPDIRIIGLNYETSISEWSPAVICPCDKIKSSLHDRAEDFLQTLANSNVGRDCPVIWVGHSMGGLVAKSIIVQSLNSTEPNIRAVGENTRAILFLGTPHKGSPVAKLKQHVQLILSPTIEVKELRENSQLLLQLQEQFEQALQKFKKPVQIVSIAEGLPTVITAFKFPMQFVNTESAKINIGDFYVLNDDHLSLSKPIFRQSFLYQRLLSIINDVITAMTDDDQI